ncbi:MAG TPA: tetratricopeptide repeat protein [Anaerolineales bacterium]|nr:tetratricopeptide repeat protein [Anaerolineales bacterium]
MGLASQSSLTEAIAAARAGDRARARELLSRLLRADSANAEYWVWMSAVVDSDREKVYCLESALKLDPSNRAALRGLVVLGARTPDDAELNAAAKVARRSKPAKVRQVRTAARPRPAIPSFNWRLIVASILGILVLAAMAELVLLLTRPGTPILAPVLPPVITDTPFLPSPTVSSTVTLTPIPVETRIMRTPVPTELVGTPLAFLVESSPTPTPILGMTPHPAYEAYDAGVQALLRGEYEQAVEYMEQVIDLDEGLADVYYFLGEASRLIEHPGEAVAAYDRAVTLNPNFAPGYLGRARTLLMVRPDEVPEDFERAITADPLFLPAYMEEASFYASRRQWERVDEVLGRAIDAGVISPEVYIRRAEAQLNRTRYGEALANAIEGSANDPSSLEGYLVLGRAYVENELHNAALWPLQTYTLYRADDPVGLAYLARAHLGVGQYDSAYEEANRALSLNDRYAMAFQTRAYVLIFRREFDAAIDDLLNARRYGRTTFEIHYGLAQAYFGLGNLVEAIRSGNSALAAAIEEEDLQVRDRKKGDSYALLATIFENTVPPRISDALNNWALLLSLQYARPEAKALAEQHALELAGEGPTRTPTLSPTPSLTSAPPITVETATPAS